MDIFEYFKVNNRVALAFSGGTDSAFLLYAATKAGCNIKAYYVKSAFQPAIEYQEVLRLTRQFGVQLKVIGLNIFEDENIYNNSPKRCYYCKKMIFMEILNAAAKDGYAVVIDGTNASDKVEERPGMKALEELGVVSPLRECGITKEMVRQMSKEANLSTHDKPSYSCLATRIKTGEVITKEKVRKTEWAEFYLMQLGFSDFRVRMIGNGAKIELHANQKNLLEQYKDVIEERFIMEYDSVAFDLEARDAK